jgi:dipeptidyl aminopeptidase/acylaminoacyl peptidase
MVRRVAVAVAAGVVLLLVSPHAQSKRFITEKDLFKFTWIADPNISPDGTTVAFVRVTVNEKENRYESSLYAVPADGSAAPRRLTSGIRDTTPRWSPDGRLLAFVRTPASQSSGGDNASKTQPSQIYLLAMDGGEARAVTDVQRGAGNPTWSPDGKTIAFSASTGRKQQEAQDAQSGKDSEKPHESDVQVITRAVYRANGNATYVDNEHHTHIFTIRLPADAMNKPAPMQLTDGEFDEGGIAWSPDGSRFIPSTRVRSRRTEAGAELFSAAAGGG